MPSFNFKYSKYKSKPVDNDGFKFASKLENEYYECLKALKNRGMVTLFLRQVPFHLPGGVKYVCDFMVLYSNGLIDFVDVKGVETSEFKVKKKLVESLYGVEINVVKRGDF